MRGAWFAARPGRATFEDGGACAIATAATEGALCKLSWLSLASNLIGDRGIEALANAIDGGALPALTELCIGHNPFNDAVRAKLREACAARRIVLKKDRYGNELL